ncbi:ATP-binding cassette domain-containing protein [Nocardia huaxiensis]|uniref:ATP-binding cassette domain-containing protein n=1 Tax=Nocardia huaxiensis TaxID=2755382 RepID=A0A7D6Z7Q4_9NOCA|nr:ATP-binding cassette domain-containing protein [Nocardia huaxiensis]QLY33804.1 ATP-binding cassette domain-containing protein [Nocardia huaxiensis]UFS99271.1 ATP-binding cassette domain-containing protein [Nocardia huaxiensis]
MQLIRFLVSISWTRIAAVVAAGLITGVANTYLVTLIRGVVSPEPHPGVTWQAFAVTGAIILAGGVLSQVLLIRLAQEAIFRLRAQLSSGIVSAPLEHLERLGMHRLMATLTEDVRSLSQAVTAIPSIVVDVATIIGCFVWLAVVSGTVFTITVAGTLLGIACVELFLKRVRRLMREARENEDALLHSFQAVTLGIKELKLHRGRRQDFMDKHLLGTADTLKRQNTEAGSKFTLGQGLGQTLQLLTMGLILFVLAKALKLPQDVMFSYVLVTTFLSMPMQNFMHRIPDLLRGDVALSKIQAMNLSMSTLHNEAALPYVERPAATSARLQLTGVSYGYMSEPPSPFPPGPGEGPPGAGMHPGPGPNGGPGQGNNGQPGHGPGGHPAHPQGGHPQGGHPQGGHPQHPGMPPGEGGPNVLRPDVNGHRFFSGAGHPPTPLGPPPGGDGTGFNLGPIDLTFEPGQITFIVGGNGSGKSTLAKLITGLYVPRDGHLTLNGERIGHDNIEWFRQNSSAIFTDFHLFEDYLGFNRPDLDGEVRKYLQELQIADKVTVENGKLSTINLSQGQRKRLALLTALLEDRSILLFDEWAADQDPRFREVFYREILADLKARGKTVIVITHDDRYFGLADQLVKLDFGRVAEVNQAQPVAAE